QTDVTSGYGDDRTRNNVNRTPCSTDEALEQQHQDDGLWEESPTGASAREGYYECLH
ncbi:hypothetical protein F442_01591, partial [Phytophthora nicotianae P10297]